MSVLNYLSFATIQTVGVFLGFVVGIWYLYYKHCFTYWKKKGVPSLPASFPFGSITTSMLGQENLFELMARYYNESKKKGLKHVGLYFFNGPIYMPIDLELIKRILTVDFEHFVDRGTFVDEKNFPLSGNLFSLEGQRWKHLRQKISPAFSSGKLKSMYEIFLKMVENLVETIDSRSLQNGEVNIKHITANYTTDIIFSVAFGLESETLKNPENKLALLVKNLFNVPLWNLIKTVFESGFQNPGNLVKAVLLNKDPEIIFSQILDNAIKMRDEGKVVRKDFLGQMLEIRDKEGLTFNEMLAEGFVFFAAGSETSSQTISLCIHELAYNQEIQDKLRNEVLQKLGTDYKKYSYEDINNLPYLDNVFNETLRLYPVLGVFNRICVKDYKIPGTDVVIKKGTPVILSMLGTHRNPDYFPEPMKFDPDRFNNKEAINPFAFLPFGDGPRVCIGMRHGKLQSKLAIAALISQFKFLPSPNTERRIKLDKVAKSLVMVPVSGITVKVEKL